MNTTLMNKILELKNISKTFPETHALKGVTVDFYQSEVHALMGENGAGKSTLVKIIAGAQKMDPGGEVFFQGKKAEINSPQNAINLGISVIYQEFNLIPELTIAENIFLGEEPKTKLGTINWPILYKKSSELLSTLKIHLDPGLKVKDAGVAQKQMVEIAKALSLNAKIIFMDEPSAALTENESQNLFAIIKELKEKKVTIVYISHRLEEIFSIADRVTVLRDGEWIGTKNITELNMEKLIQMMVGREIQERYPSRNTKVTNEAILEVKNIQQGSKLKDISFTLHKGEILGFAGLVGAGRSSLARVVFGADPKEKGEIYVKGNKADIKSPKDALKAGIALVPEDRREEGLIMEMSLGNNITLGNLNDVCKNKFIINHKKEKNVIEHYINELNIKASSHHQNVRFLSGGNQQKVVIAKWLFIPSHVIIFDEPTRGIDVGAKHEIYNLLNKLVSDGIGIIVISSELLEIMGICDRIIVMHNGKFTGTLNKNEFSQERILKLATGN